MAFYTAVCPLPPPLPPISHSPYLSSSSEDQDSPFTPDFPSPQSLDHKPHINIQCPESYYPTWSPAPTPFLEYPHPYPSESHFTPPKTPLSYFHSSDLHLHAPTPLSTQSPLLLSDPALYELPPSHISPPYSPPPPTSIPRAPFISRQTSYASAYAPHHATFPTPSEILGELSATYSSPLWNTIHPSAPLHPKPLGISRQPRRTKPLAAPPSFAQPPASTASTLDAFLITPSSLNINGDGITSHEKKRHYLECLEQYVIFLHQQLLNVGLQPPHLERTTQNTRGMTSKSIRTLLVHMKHLKRQLDIRTVSEEERFLRLRDSLSQHDQS